MMINQPNVRAVATCIALLSLAAGACGNDDDDADSVDGDMPAETSVADPPTATTTVAVPTTTMEPDPLFEYSATASAVDSEPDHVAFCDALNETYGGPPGAQEGEGPDVPLDDPVRLEAHTREHLDTTRELVRLAPDSIRPSIERIYAQELFVVALGEQFDWIYEGEMRSLDTQALNHPATRKALDQETIYWRYECPDAD